MLLSENVKVLYLANRFINCCNSVIGGNVNVICKRLMCNRIQVSHWNIKEKFLYNYEDVKAICAQILEVKDLLDNNSVLHGFTKGEIYDIFYDLCTG